MEKIGLDDGRSDAKENVEDIVAGERPNTEDEKHRRAERMRILLEQMQGAVPDMSFLQDGAESENDEDDYHNKSSDLANLGNLKEAIEVCLKGLEKFPYSIDLSADTVKYSSDIGDDETAQKYFLRLYQNIPRPIWNWRAFTFSLDYLMKNPLKNEEICRELISDYYKYLPFEEKAAVAESILEEKVGNHARSKEILKRIISKRYNAPQSALRLLDLQMRYGEFEEALKTSDYFAIASCEVQPTVNQNYQLYVRCLAEDAMIHKVYYDNGHVTDKEIEHIRRRYEMLLENPEIAVRFGLNIRNRILMLNFLRTDIG